MRQPRWPPVLLATVGVGLIAAGFALWVLPYALGISKAVVAPSPLCIALGVMLVVMAAFHQSAYGRLRLLGWELNYGRKPDVHPEASPAPALLDVIAAKRMPRTALRVSRPARD